MSTPQYYLDDHPLHAMSNAKVEWLDAWWFWCTEQHKKDTGHSVVSQVKARINDYAEDSRYTNAVY